MKCLIQVLVLTILAGSGLVCHQKSKVLDGESSKFAEIKEAVAHNDVAVLSLDARPGRVEASVRLHGTVRSSERSGSLPAIHFFAIRDGLIGRIETYRPDWRGSD